MSWRLTKKAKDRLEERTSISEEEMCHLLNFRQYVVVGIEPYSNRVHKLIYSLPDQAHFVVIDDIKTQQVITVLPLAHHENLAPPIPKAKLREAKQIAGHREPSPINHRPPPLSAKKCEISVTFHTEKSFKKQLGSHRFDNPPETLEEAFNDSALISKIWVKLKEKKYPTENIETILVYDNHTGYLLTIPWETLSGCGGWED